MYEIVWICYIIVTYVSNSLAFLGIDPFHWQLEMCVFFPEITQKRSIQLKYAPIFVVTTPPHSHALLMFGKSRWQPSCWCIHIADPFERRNSPNRRKDRLWRAEALQWRDLVAGYVWLHLVTVRNSNCCWNMLKSLWLNLIEPIHWMVFHIVPPKKSYHPRCQVLFPCPKYLKPVAQKPWSL